MRAVSVFLCGLAVWVAAGRPATAADGESKVSVDSAEVHSQMSRTSPIVKTLKRGDAVVVELSLEGAGENWCSISEQATSRTLGYIPCAQIEMQKPDSAAWQRAEQAPRGAAAAQGVGKPPAGDPLAEILKVCPALKNPTPQRFADFLQGAACAAMLQGGSPRLYTPAQLNRIQAIAERTGAQACYEQLIAGYRARGAIGANGRVTDVAGLYAGARDLFAKHPGCAGSMTAFNREAIEITDPKAARQLKELEDKLKSAQ